MTKGRLLFSFLVLWFASIGFVNAQNSCSTPANIRLGFFNGVANNWKLADRSREKLSELYSSGTPSGASISYELYYNTTQGFGDFVETFEQRLREQDAIFNDKFYLFYEAINGGGEFTDAIKAAIPAFNGFMDSMRDYVTAKLVSILTETAALIGDINNIEPNTFAVHARQIDNVIAAGDRFLIFSHSQGNLFANRAFGYYKTKAPENTARVVHVAPASAITSGPWTLAYQDFVINALRLTGSVVDSTTMIPDYILRPKGLNGKTDISGHGLLEIYLNPALPTRSRIDGHVNTAISELSEFSGSQDCIRITRVSCAPITVDGQPRMKWDIEGVAYGRRSMTFVNASPNASVVDNRRLSSCSSWSGTTVLNGYQMCARESTEAAYTEWTSTNTANMSLGVVAELYWAPTNFPLNVEIQTLARHDVNVPSCPGTYVVN